ncbi:hypothetical protein ABZZ74_23300 [Streptomyces sp. NPDC006476]|uniref:hypothetical protein n=1 Tax=Streptomyces sp. NPDC006476 TaxID=3157175 RepID=UPI0033B2987F
MAKGKVPAVLKAHQFTKGSAKAKAAGAKGGKVSPTRTASAKTTAAKTKGGK